MLHPAWKLTFNYTGVNYAPLTFKLCLLWVKLCLLNIRLCLLKFKLCLLTFR